MRFSTYKFKNHKIFLVSGNKKSTGVSKSSLILSDIIPSLLNMNILDVGCGIGYMTTGALFAGARKVVATDISNMNKILRENIKINNFNQKQLIFIKSNLFSNVPKSIKFNAIIANLPQHALPATPSAKNLKGKYGGYDGTDLVCKSLTEGAYYLQSGGKYFGAVSRLTNFKRTMDLAKCLYKIKIRKTILKTLTRNEMSPYVSEEELFNHLRKLKERKLVEYTGGARKPIIYKVHLCEFILKGEKFLH